MFLFPVDGIMETILSYGQTLSLFLVFVIMEGMIAAKSESKWPGLVFVGLIVLLAIALGILFDDIGFFVYMMVPAVLSLIAYYFTRRNRAKNIQKGMHYNKDGLLEEEMQQIEKMEQK